MERSNSTSIHAVHFLSTRAFVRLRCDEIGLAGLLSFLLIFLQQVCKGHIAREGRTMERGIAKEVFYCDLKQKELKQKQQLVLKSARKCTKMEIPR